jgi:hypothetical protein
MHSVVKRWTWPVLVGLVLGCSKPTTTTTTLPAPEAFNFAAQPIVFSPPPAGWEPEPELSGGIRGTRYVKRNSVGEAITIGNYHDVSNRLRQTETAALLAVNSDYASREFDHALRAAWPATENPYSDLESEVAAKVNAALSRAAQARKQRDYETMRRELLSAQEQAGRLHFRFEDVIERALFRPENTSDPSPASRRWLSTTRWKRAKAGAIFEEPTSCTTTTCSWPSSSGSRHRYLCSTRS